MNFPTLSNPILTYIFCNTTRIIQLKMVGTFNMHFLISVIGCSNRTFPFHQTVCWHYNQTFHQAPYMHSCETPNKRRIIKNQKTITNRSIKHSIGFGEKKISNTHNFYFYDPLKHQLKVQNIYKSLNFPSFTLTHCTLAFSILMDY